MSDEQLMGHCRVWTLTAICYRRNLSLSRISRNSKWNCGSEILTDCLGQANNSSHPHIHAVKVTNYKCQISKSFLLPTIIDGSVKIFTLFCISFIISFFLLSKVFIPESLMRCLLPNAWFPEFFKFHDCFDQSQWKFLFDIYFFLK